MFNIVKRRDFMLGNDVATREEAAQAALDYGREYVVVQTQEILVLPALEAPGTLIAE
jgi:hypothetical protein